MGVLIAGVLRTVRQHKFLLVASALALTCCWGGSVGETQSPVGLLKLLFIYITMSCQPSRVYFKKNTRAKREAKTS